MKPKRRNKLPKRKLLFALYYFDHKRKYSKNYGNAYRCAFKAGYSESYSKKILSQMSWVELAWRIEKTGLIILDESTRNYVKRVIVKKLLEEKFGKYQ